MTEFTKNTICTYFVYKHSFIMFLGWFFF